MDSRGGRTFEAELERAKGGDKSALDRLLEPHLGWLLLCVRKRWPRHLDAKQSPSDLIQSVAREVNETIGRCTSRDETVFRNWLRGILENCRRRALKSWGRIRRNPSCERPIQDGWAASPEPRDGRTPVPERVVKREEAEWLDQALAYLDDEDRELLRLRHWEGLIFDQIAAQLTQNPDPAAVKKESDRIRKRIPTLEERLRRGIPLLQWMQQQGWPPAYREAIGLWSIRPRTPKQVAQQLKIPEAAVKARIQMLPASFHRHPGPEDTP